MYLPPEPWNFLSGLGAVVHKDCAGGRIVLSSWREARAVRSGSGGRKPRS